MSTVLAMDTSGPSLSVALVRDGKAVFERTQQNGRTHSASLMPLVDEALQTGGIRMAQVDLLAAVHGPGSFTGVRIGVATAKGLAHAAGKPCLGVNALEALSRNAGLFCGAVCALQDARAGQVYCAAYRDGERVLKDAAKKLSEFLEEARRLGRCCFVGDGAAAHRSGIAEAMGELAVFAPESDMMIRASHVALLALEKAHLAGTWRELLPYYLRAPQAERERAAREAGRV